MADNVFLYAPNAVYNLSGLLHFTTHDSDCVTQDLINEHPQLYFFSSEIPEVYLPFCADFGPNGICAVLEFCDFMHGVLHHPRLAKRPKIFYTSPCENHVTNSAFLLCCYLMLEEEFSPEDALQKFVNIRGLPVKPFRDAAWNQSTYDLSPLSCLRGLRKAITHKSKIFDLDTFSIRAYAANYDRDTCDISRVSPKFVAFATPKVRADEFTGVRLPSEHFGPFRAMGVTDVVRLSGEGVYDDASFTEAGFKHHALEFADCTAPTTNMVKRFLDICDAAGDGAVAVHCLAGLGRTGTLIACYMIKNQGFEAAEAIGFLRLMRPGSVIGSQQHFLERIHDASWDGNTPVLEPTTPSSPLEAASNAHHSEANDTTPSVAEGSTRRESEGSVGSNQVQACGYMLQTNGSGSCTSSCSSALSLAGTITGEAEGGDEANIEAARKMGRDVLEGRRLHLRKRALDGITGRLQKLGEFGSEASCAQET